jgi:hypothetical protein
MPDEAIIKISVELPRTTILALRKYFGAELPLNELVLRAAKEVAQPVGDKTVVSRETLRQLASMLAVETINSEQALVEAVKQRFKISEHSVLLELDPNLTAAVEETARRNNITFRDSLRNYIELGFARGLFDQPWDQYAMFFSSPEWKRLKAALGKVPSDAKHLVEALEEWRRAASVAPVQVQPPEPATSRPTDGPRATAR